MENHSNMIPKWTGELHTLVLKGDMNHIPASLDNQKLQKAKNAFIKLPGQFTGDIWHVAAAQILSGYTNTTLKTEDPFPEIIFRTAITIDKNQYSEPQGKRSWQYLKDIQLHAVVVKQDTAWEECNEAASSKPESDFTVWKPKDLKCAKINEDYMIHLWCSTSVVMAQMQYLGPAVAQAILGFRLSGGSPGGSIENEVLAAAADKLRELIGVMKQARDWSDKAVREGAEIPNFKGVLIFNVRVGDVNKQHDSNLDLLAQVKTLAAARGLVTIIVPQMRHDEWRSTERQLDPGTVPENPYEGNYVFDLLNVSKTTAPPMDNRVKACFWQAVAAHLQINSPVSRSSSALDEFRCVHGFIGGRSGSTDLPAFVGVKAFSWDEPYLTPLPNAAASETMSDKKRFDSEFPQMLRLLNEFPVMRTGFLDGTTLKEKEDPKTKRKVREYGRLSIADGILGDWLDNVPLEKARISPLGVDKAFADHCLGMYQPRIEKKARFGAKPPLNIRAVYLDKYKSFQSDPDMVVSKKDSKDEIDD